MRVHSHWRWQQFPDFYCRFTISLPAPTVEHNHLILPTLVFVSHTLSYTIMTHDMLQLPVGALALTRLMLIAAYCFRTSFYERSTFV